MKKIFFLLSFALVMFAVTSCGGSDSNGGASNDTPKGAVENFLKAAKAGDTKAFAECLLDNEGKPVKADEEAIKAAEPIVQGLAAELKDADYTVGDEKIAEDGNTATVTVTLKANGEELSNNFNLVKVDGKWYIKLF